MRDVHPTNPLPANGSPCERVELLRGDGAGLGVALEYLLRDRGVRAALLRLREAGFEPR